MKVRTLITAGIVLVAGMSTAHADGPYGFNASSPEECTAEYPVHVLFEDGSAGCYRADTPGVREEPWEAGEFESLLLESEGYDLTPEERAGLEAATEGTPYESPKTKAKTPPTQHRPGLPKTGW